MTILLALAVTLFGIASYFRLPVSDLPSVDYPVIQVTAVFPGMDAATMAANVATPLEKEFLKIQGLEMVTSSNLQGQTRITLQFISEKNIDAAATDVQSAIQRSLGNLPADMPSPPIFEKTDPNSQPIFYVTLTSATLTLGELYDYASDNVAQKFNIVKGVSKSDVYGPKRAIRIEVDPQQLCNRGLTMDEVVNAIRQSTATISAGRFQGKYRALILKPEGQLERAKDYANIVVAYRDGMPVYLHDLGECFEGVQTDDFASSFWMREYGEFNASVIVAVTRAAGANTVQVTRTLRNLLPEISRELPNSVMLNVTYDRSLSIVESINDVQETVIIAFILVTVVIFFFLGRVRDTIIPLVALPLSLCMLFIAMYALGFSLDNLSLMAITLSVGFLVDDAIVFLENMVRRMQKLKESPEDAAINGANEISSTIVSMTLSLASIFIPLVFMRGQVGRVFHEFSMVIILATLSSGVISLTLTPLMCARMLRNTDLESETAVERFAHGLEEWILKYYGRALYFFLNVKSLSLVIWVLCVLGTGWLFVKLPKIFLPDGDSGVISGIMLAQEGTSSEQMKVYQRRINAIMRADPAIKTQFALVGIPGMATNQGMILAFLNDTKTREPVQRVSHKLAMQLARIPGVLCLIRPMPALKIETGAVQTNQGKYAYTISGIKPEEVYAAAQKMLQLLRPYKALASISSDMFLNNPELKIAMLRDQIAAYGSNVAAYENQLKNAYSENYAYLIKAPTQQYQVVVTAAKRFRAQANDLDRLHFHGRDPEEMLQATTLSSWQSSTGPLMVNHTNNFPSATIFFDLKPGVAIGDVVAHIERLAEANVPKGLIANFQGEAQSFQETFSSLKILLLIAVFVTYVILGILYESYIHPITVLSALPVAMFGGLATLLLFHQELSLYGYIGLFMLLGLVEKNGIMIIDFALQRQQEEGLSPYDAIHRASMQRFRPILMTTLATVMGSVPIALGWGADGASRRPLGLVVVGGMLFAQLITLFVTPALYLYMDRFQTNVLDKIAFFRRGNLDARPAQESEGLDAGRETVSADGMVLPDPNVEKGGIELEDSPMAADSESQAEMAPPAVTEARQKSAVESAGSAIVNVKKTSRPPSKSHVRLKETAEDSDKSSSENHEENSPTSEEG